jgi:hypothetical protein
MMKSSQVQPAEDRVKFLQEFMKQHGASEYLQYELDTLMSDLQDYYDTCEMEAQAELDYMNDFEDRFTASW